MAEKLATLSFSDGKPSIDFPVLDGTVGPEVIDVRSLYGKTGMFTYDPGFMSTASCRSKITYIDGDQGILMYRGYPIEQLAETCSFLEVAYLILNGELPNKTQLEEFVDIVTHHTMVHEQLSRFYQRLPPGRASDGRAVRGGGRALRFLPRLDQHLRSRAAARSRRSG